MIDPKLYSIGVTVYIDLEYTKIDSLGTGVKPQHGRYPFMVEHDCACHAIVRIVIFIYIAPTDGLTFGALRFRDNQGGLFAVITPFAGFPYGYILTVLWIPPNLADLQVYRIADPGTENTCIQKAE